MNFIRGFVPQPTGELTALPQTPTWEEGTRCPSPKTAPVPQPFGSHCQHSERSPKINTSYGLESWVCAAMLTEGTPLVFYLFLFLLFSALSPPPSATLPSAGSLDSLGLNCCDTSANLNTMISRCKNLSFEAFTIKITFKNWQRKG